MIYWLNKNGYKYTKFRSFVKKLFNKCWHLNSFTGFFYIYECPKCGILGKWKKKQ